MKLIEIPGKTIYLFKDCNWACLLPIMQWNLIENIVIIFGCNHLKQTYMEFIFF